MGNCICYRSTDRNDRIEIKNKPKAREKRKPPETEDWRSSKRFRNSPLNQDEKLKAKSEHEHRRNDRSESRVKEDRKKIYDRSKSPSGEYLSRRLFKTRLG